RGLRKAVARVLGLNYEYRGKLRTAGGHQMRREGFLTLVLLFTLALAAPAASASAADQAHLASISVSASRLEVGDTFTVTAQATNPSGGEYGVGFWFDP